MLIFPLVDEENLLHVRLQIALRSLGPCISHLDSQWFMGHVSTIFLEAPTAQRFQQQPALCWVSLSRVIPGLLIPARSSPLVLTESLSVISYIMGASAVHYIQVPSTVSFLYSASSWVMPTYCKGFAAHTHAWQVVALSPRLPWPPTLL